MALFVHISLEIRSIKMRRGKRHVVRGVIESSIGVATELISTIKLQVNQ